MTNSETCPECDTPDYKVIERATSANDHGVFTSLLQCNDCGAAWDVDR